MKKGIFLIIWVCCFAISKAQNIVFTQTIKGTVTDRQSGNVLQNITVSIDNSSLHLNAVTDEKGNFSIALPKGTYSVQIQEKTQDYEKGMMAQFGKSENCKKWKNAADFTIIVAKKIKMVQAFKMHLGCNGCTPPRP